MGIPWLSPMAAALGLVSQAAPQPLDGPFSWMGCNFYIQMARCSLMPELFGTLHI